MWTSRRTLEFLSTIQRKTQPAIPLTRSHSRLLPAFWGLCPSPARSTRALPIRVQIRVGIRIRIGIRVGRRIRQRIRIGGRSRRSRGSADQIDSHSWSHGREPDLRRVSTIGEPGKQLPTAARSVSTSCSKSMFWRSDAASCRGANSAVVCGRLVPPSFFASC